jgi:uncharacterized protein (DUF983 family)
MQNSDERIKEKKKEREKSMTEKNIWEYTRRCKRCGNDFKTFLSHGKICKGCEKRKGRKRKKS